MADYNGWADAAEEEREALDVFDHTDALRSPMLVPVPAHRCPDPFAGLEPGDLTHVPWHYNPYDTEGPLEPDY